MRASTTAFVGTFDRLRSQRATSTQSHSGMSEVTLATGGGKSLPRSPKTSLTKRNHKNRNLILDTAPVIRHLHVMVEEVRPSEIVDLWLQ
jgi:hypothetical protein